MGTLTRSPWRWLDKLALAGLAVGLAIYVMPWWQEGRLRLAFWITLAATVLHVFTSHRKEVTGG
jgi:hypothetical protein